MTFWESLGALAFLAVFVSMWLVVTRMLGVTSGWDTLQERYRDTDEQPLLELRGQSGSLNGVSYRSILDLATCRSGLRVSVWKLFGPWQKPFLVPWAQIKAEDANLLFFKMTRLTFDSDAGRDFKLMRGAWEKLVAARFGA